MWIGTCLKSSTLNVTDEGHLWALSEVYGGLLLGLIIAFLQSRH